MKGLHPSIVNVAAPWRLKTTFPVLPHHLTGADAPPANEGSGKVNLVTTGINLGAMFVVIGMFVGVAYLYKKYD
jgi:hypothetical protein